MEQPVPNQNTPNGAQRGTFFGSMLRMILFYFAMRAFFGNRSSPKMGPDGKPFPSHLNLFDLNQQMDLRVYITENEEFTDFSEKSLVWLEKDIFYNWQEENNRENFINISTSESLQRNGSYYAHVFINKIGFDPDPNSISYNRTAIVYGRYRLNDFLPKRKVTLKKNLISGERETLEVSSMVEDETETQENVSYWKPNLNIRLLCDHTVYPNGAIPLQFAKDIQRSIFSVCVFYLNSFTYSNYSYIM